MYLRNVRSLYGGLRTPKDRRQTDHPHRKVRRWSILVESSNAELAAKLGLKTTGQRSHYDLIPWHRPPGHVIIGGGPG